MRAPTLSVLMMLAALAPAAGQVTTAPRAMGLPDAAPARPDPTDHSVELSNGLVAYVAEDRSAPLVTVTAFVNVGYADGPDGAAEALAHAYRVSGPAEMESGTFQAMLRDMTADYRVVLGPEHFEITLDVPTEDGPAALSLLGRLVREGPALQGLDLGALAGRVEGAPSRYEGSLASATQVLRSRLLSNTPYAPEPGDGALARLSTEVVRDFHRDHFVAANMALAVAGDWSSAQAQAGLVAFEAVPEGARLIRRPLPAPPARPGRVFHLLNADKLQGWLVLGSVLPAIPERDQAALEVMNYILGGGHFDTRLFREARDKRGLTNDDSGFLEPARNGPGTYTFRTYGRPEVVRLLLDLTLQEIDRIREEAVTEEELFVAKGALADGVFAARYRDGWATARSLAEEWMAYGGHSRSESYVARMRDVSAEDVLRAARRYLQPEAMTGVIIGPIAAIEAAPAREGEGRLASYADLVRDR